MPTVSVIMPCYNTAATIEEALDSICRQTLEDFELIVVDDGSTDSTANILRTWAIRDKRIRVITHPHRGIVDSLNVGLNNCQSPYCARMDSDDRSHPERLALQAGYLIAHPEIALVSCLVKGFPEGKVREGYRIYMEWLNGLLSNVDIRREIFIESPLPHPSVMFRQQKIVDIGGYQERGWAEDYDLWLRLYLAGEQFSKLSQILLEWREHPDRLTRTDPRYSLENFLRAKAFYLARGPLTNRDAVIVWGAGMMGRRLSKHLIREGIPLAAFLDIDPRKIGHTLRGLPIEPIEKLPFLLEMYSDPVVLSAVGSRGARKLIRDHLNSIDLREGSEWWAVA